MQRYANQMPNAFNDATKVMKSHIVAANVPVGQYSEVANSLSVARLKRGRPSDSKGLVI